MLTLYIDVWLIRWWCGCICYQVLISVCVLHCSELELILILLLKQFPYASVGEKKIVNIKMHGTTVKKESYVELFETRNCLLIDTVM